MTFNLRNWDYMGIKTKLKGAFDLLFLFGRGIHAFSGSKRDAILSFSIPCVIFPMTLFFSVFYPPKGMETGYSNSQILITVSLHVVISFLLSLTVIFLLSRVLKKSGKLWLFLEAYNWTGLAIFLVTLPLTQAAIFDWIPREEMDRIFVIVQCFSYVVTASIIFHSFQLNWQFSGFMAIVILFIDQTMWDILFMLQDIPKPW
ncbi:MAG: hypothetical protein KAI76_04865 [Alphaproteobacteria bacterium]|nr:hypothetical protein [Alphaproteobacteria bacterium]